MSHLLYPAVVISGILIGYLGWQPDFLAEYSIPELLLYLLIMQVGLGVGMRPDLKKLIKNFNLKMLMLPVCTITGTLVFTLIASMIFYEDLWTDIMAVGSGFGYYSLSSVLISQMKTAAGEIDAAASIAAVALLANVSRELLALFSCRWLSARGKGMTAISVAGVTSMDVCLPMILGDSRNADSRLVSAAIFHGIALEISVPVLITIFCG